MSSWEDRKPLKCPFKAYEEGSTQAMTSRVRKTSSRASVSSRQIAYPQLFQGRLFSHVLTAHRTIKPEQGCAYSPGFRWNPAEYFHSFFVPQVCVTNKSIVCTLQITILSGAQKEAVVLFSSLTNITQPCHININFDSSVS